MVVESQIEGSGPVSCRRSESNYDSICDRIQCCATPRSSTRFSRNALDGFGRDSVRLVEQVWRGASRDAGDSLARIREHVPAGRQTRPRRDLPRQATCQTDPGS